MRSMKGMLMCGDCIGCHDTCVSGIKLVILKEKPVME